MGFETDDPTGGRNLTRRLVIALPCALLLGAAVGVALAVVLDEWRMVPLLAVLAAGVTGGVLAALEDGRVQRRVARRQAMAASRRQTPERRG